VAWRIIIIIIKAADDAMHARQKKTNRGDSQQQHKAATWLGESYMTKMSSVVLWKAAKDVARMAPARDTMFAGAISFSNFLSVSK